MASPAPAKSQQKPLHNFPLPSLWSKSHHRGRRHHTAASPPPENRRISDSTVEKAPQWESRRISVSIPRPCHPTAHKKPPLPTPPPPSDRKISIKIRGTHLPKRESEAEEREREREAEAKEEREKEREREREAKEERERERKREREAKDDELAKTWNLRPRKQHKTKRNNVNLPENKTICAASEAAAEGGDKPKFSLSLSKTEIEDDLFAMTGSRPTRRPKKRPRTLQKQLDDIFPGMWLHSITPESYKVNEASEKP